MKRFFVIRTHKFGHLWQNEKGEIPFFDNKEEAKRVRDQTNIPTAVVSNGPDHKKCTARDVRSLR
jgi:hypothetical protein